MFEAMSQNLTSVAIFPVMRNALEWLLCGSTTILAYNSIMVARQVAKISQKYECAHKSSIFEPTRQSFKFISIFPANKKIMEWLLCESTIILAYNSNMASW